MHWMVVQKILGIFMLLFSAMMLPPAGIALWYGDGGLLVFLLSFVLTMALGLILWLSARHKQAELRRHDGFMIVFMFWISLGLIGAVPFMLAQTPHMSLADAVFESVSGLTTTGATVIVGLDDLPHSILWYRQQLQWFGGIGVIVLAIAILPMLGVGGMQLYRAETPGPFKDVKLTPRLSETAKALFMLYFFFTVLCALLYWAADMGPFDAVGHAFSTVATGGYSTHDASMGYFQSPLIEGITIVFMLLGGINFSVHYFALRAFNFKVYWHDAECRGFLRWMLFLTTIISIYLFFHHTYVNPLDAFLKGIFQVVSIGTSTGYTTAQFFIWPGFLPVLLIFSSFVGGSAGSTAGGVKVVRWLLLLEQGKTEIRQLIHPNALFPIRLGERVVDDAIIKAVWGFFSAYVMVFALIMLILMADGLDQVTAFSATAACLNNLGPGLGKVASHFGDLHAFDKWILSLAMILGRLEIFTLLVVFSPSFWRA